MSRRPSWSLCPIIVVLAVCLLGAAQEAPVDSLDRARSLFAGAAYEDALGMLDRLRAAPGAAEGALRDTEALRAICLLALGRDDDARAAMIAVIDLDPQFEYPEADVAPRIRSTYLALRTERLPDVVRARYAAARAAFAAEDYATATSRFRAVIALLDDPALASALSATTFGDLKTLASGFYDLSVKESNLAAARTAPGPATPGAPASTQPGSDSPARSVASNAGSDTTPGDIKPPVPTDQRMPALMQLVAEKDKPYRASIRIIIDENGRVASANLVASSTPTYDRLVVDSVKSWRYRPATRNGVAVPYARTVDVTIAPATR